MVPFVVRCARAHPRLDHCRPGTSPRASPDSGAWAGARRRGLLDFDHKFELPIGLAPTDADRETRRREQGVRRAVRAVHVGRDQNGRMPVRHRTAADAMEDVLQNCLTDPLALTSCEHSKQLHMVELATGGIIDVRRNRHTAVFATCDDTYTRWNERRAQTTHRCAHFAEPRRILPACAAFEGLQPRSICLNRSTRRQATQAVSRITRRPTVGSAILERSLSSSRGSRFGH